MTVNKPDAEEIIARISLIDPSGINSTNFRSVSSYLGKELSDLTHATKELSHLKSISNEEIPIVKKKLEFIVSKMPEIKTKLDSIFTAIMYAEELVKKESKESFKMRIRHRFDAIIHYKSDTLNALLNKANAFSLQIIEHKCRTDNFPPIKEISPRERRLEMVQQYKFRNPKKLNPLDRWMTVVKKAKNIGKGSLHEGSQILDESYWMETLIFKIKGMGVRNKKARAYQNYLAPFFNDWKNKRDSEGTLFCEKTDFTTYLMDILPNLSQEDLKLLKSNKIKYLRVDKKRDYEVSFHEGKMLQNGVQIPNGNYMYVLSPDQKTLYMGKKIRGKFHHSSFLGGGAVMSAGMMDVKDGNIARIFMYSGHYKPGPKQVEGILNYFSAESRLGSQVYNIEIIKANPASILDRFSHWLMLRSPFFRKLLT